MSKTFIIAEIGINHNGDIDIAKKLIESARHAGCDAVKFQKRTIDVVYTKEDLDRTRESPWGTTNREQKEGLEFGKEEYDEIDRYCKEKGIEWFASAWDIESQNFLRQYDLKYNKVASAMLTHRELLETIAEEGRHTFISTGMSTVTQVQKAVKIFKDKKCPFELMYCNSTYPMPLEEANLNAMKAMKKTFGESVNVGYSGHETGLIVSCAAAALGASSIERHITLDRTMYGSDQSASVESGGLRRLVDYIRSIENAMGSGFKHVSEKEKQIAKKLRRVDTL
jgi:N-acetylneuraminate synthase